MVESVLIAYVVVDGKATHLGRKGGHGHRATTCYVHGPAISHGYPLVRHALEGEEARSGKATGPTGLSGKSMGNYSYHEARKHGRLARLHTRKRRGPREHRIIRKDHRYRFARRKKNT